jgi:ferredoxin
VSDKSKKNPLDAPGKYYVNEYCLACENCQLTAPNYFRYDEPGHTYVFKQPGTSEEEAQCRQALLECPMEAIQDDGRAPNILFTLYQRLLQLVAE